MSRTHTDRSPINRPSAFKAAMANSMFTSAITTVRSSSDFSALIERLHTQTRPFACCLVATRE